jgi:phage-related minor tail protein
VDNVDSTEPRDEKPDVAAAAYGGPQPPGLNQEDSMAQQVATGQRAGEQRSDEQRAREQVMGEVSDVLLNLEHAINRSKRALANIRKAGGSQNEELVLTETLEELQKLRKRLMQGTYYAVETRMF